jgi:hypothetical protein
MESKKLNERKIKEIEEAARHWGKLLAREAFPGGPDLKALTKPGQAPSPGSLFPAFGKSRGSQSRFC